MNILKRIISVVLIAVLMLFAFTACSNKNDTTDLKKSEKVKATTTEKQYPKILNTADSPMLSRVYLESMFLVCFVNSDGSLRYVESEPTKDKDMLNMFDEMKQIDDAVSLLWADLRIVYLNNKGQVIEINPSGVDGTAIPKHEILLENVTKVSDKYNLTGVAYGIRKDGSVALYYDDYTDFHSNIKQAENWTNIEKIAGGFTAVVGLKKDGSVVATGDNYNGRIDTVNSWGKMKDIAVFDEKQHVRDGINEYSYAYIAGVTAKGTIKIAGSCYYADRFSHIKNAEKISVDQLGAAVLKTDGTVEVIVPLGYSENCEANKWTDIVEIKMHDSMIYGVKADGTLLFAHKNGLKDDGTEWFPGDRKNRLQ